MKNVFRALSLMFIFSATAHAADSVAVCSGTCFLRYNGAVVNDARTTLESGTGDTKAEAYLNLVKACQLDQAKAGADWSVTLVNTFKGESGWDGSANIVPFNVNNDCAQ